MSGDCEQEMPVLYDLVGQTIAEYDPKQRVI
jgi:hypothetical protein